MTNPDQSDKPDNSPGLGGGAYNDECDAAMMATAAHCVCLMVFDGNRGTGFSVATHDPTFAKKLPIILRNIADQIEQVMATAKGN